MISQQSLSFSQCLRSSCWKLLHHGTHITLPQALMCHSVRLSWTSVIQWLENQFKQKSFHQFVCVCSNLCCCQTHPSCGLQFSKDTKTYQIANKPHSYFTCSLQQLFPFKQMQPIGDSDRFVIWKGQIKRREKIQTHHWVLIKRTRNLISGQKESVYSAYNTLIMSDSPVAHNELLW